MRYVFYGPPLSVLVGILASQDRLSKFGQLYSSLIHLNDLLLLF